MITHYADYLKYIAVKYFGGTYKKTPEMRNLLQKLGTDIVRKREPNYWVDTVVNFVKVFGRDFDFIIIPDARFPNEILRWKEENIDVASIHVQRINFENDLTPEQRSHTSENALNDFKFDYYIKSESGVDCLKHEVIKTLLLEGGILCPN